MSRDLLGKIPCTRCTVPDTHSLCLARKQPPSALWTPPHARLDCNIIPISMGNTTYEQCSANETMYLYHCLYLCVYYLSMSVCVFMCETRACILCICWAMRANVSQVAILNYLCSIFYFVSFGNKLHVFIAQFHYHFLF